ncbi:hypothetical protein DKM44_09090 [Deinococcus irradiatisoli]|uniref:Uncharacterized protein n=1 Tax=Deinococcus irradiatisoli TaxID=2202254 RepID=A0A2Z3JRD0_9DEIO|nr:hypothetical protein [Deinococcus irradiatisoli]AWN23364.1 hypothetical protein DKM44_09090 [Deinococcus irradiatisoli]
MSSDTFKPAAEPGEIVQSSLPDERPDVIDVPQDAPQNESPTDKAAKLQQESASPTELIPSDEDG